ncbi:MAG: acetyl-CoA carboxylase biotin carboxylase subunit [Candidatus Sericytochromatia bacterium]|nr:acetyl-CoA carboxylase biotin carboxylase subunit [Candidatus Sericytochromatia bacterium]
MFKKILIANRGEIAVRIIKTCKEMNISTLAIYSEADKDALHVKVADEAFLVGEAPVMKSYLNMDKIFEVAKANNVDAIHPGYGLLSENALFADKCQELGIIFIGPSTQSMKKMSLKVESRQLAKQIGLPLVPGTEIINSVDELRAEAAKIGFPIMIKASAGGGGIGMELIHNPESLEKAFKLAQSRAKAYFGNPAIYLEKFVEEPRHIEVQIFADKQNNFVHLGERECSIQRRHQKVVEESPSVFLNNETRKQMTDAAIKIAKAVNYENAGTVEFIVNSKTGDFYFLEMNTRLQVEHPITEKVTGLDLVKEQINIAYGLPFSLSQEQITFNGHAIECRIYAEDPVTFMPSPGKITHLEMSETENFRVDTAIYQDYTVTPFYDPLLAKVISYGDTREEAIKIMLDSLNKTKIEGIKSNIELHKKILASSLFHDGNTTTDFLSKL